MSTATWSFLRPLRLRWVYPPGLQGDFMAFRPILVLHNFTPFVLVHYKYSGTRLFPSIAFYFGLDSFTKYLPTQSFPPQGFRLTLAS